MPEPIQETKTEVTPEVQPQETSETPKEDLVSRASKVTLEPEQKGTQPLEQAAPNFKTVEEAVEWAANKEKEWASGYGKKFQELAEMRKSFEANKSAPSTWTPERIQNELLKDPTFVQAAQSVANAQTDGNDSMLTENDRKLIDESKKASQFALLQARKAERARQDEVNKAKYANYKPEAVDIIEADLLAGKVQATREYLFKASDYEAMAKRSYELGRRDEREGINTKVQVSSPGGYTAVSQTDFEPKKGESDNQVWERASKNAIAKLAQVNQVRT